MQTQYTLGTGGNPFDFYRAHIDVVFNLIVCCSH